MANETLNIQNGVSPITIDTEVTEGSMRPVTSDGIYKAIQAGGGGGGSSSVLDVVCTVTETDGVASYDYSVSNEETLAAVNAGKAIRLTIKSLVAYAMCLFPTVNVGLNDTAISFVLVSPVSYYIPIEVAKLYSFNTETGSWQQIDNEHSQIPLARSSFSNSRWDVPQLTIDQSLSLDKISRIFEVGGALAQLVQGSIGTAGTAIGTTITDPDVLTELTMLANDALQCAIHGKPAKIFDTYSGTTYGFDIISTAHEQGVTQDYRLTSMAATTSLIAAGNLCHIALSFAYTYGNADDDQITQAQIAAYCDSHTITFM